MEKYTVVSGSLEQLEGHPDLLKPIEETILNKIPSGYELESSSYEKTEDGLHYGFKVVAKKAK